MEGLRFSSLHHHISMRYFCSSMGRPGPKPGPEPEPVLIPRERHRYHPQRERGCLSLSQSFLATAWASFREGLYLPPSRKTMVSLLTPTASARSAWVMSRRARYSFIRVFMGSTLLLPWHIAFPQSAGNYRRINLYLLSISHYCYNNITLSKEWSTLISGSTREVR